MLIQSICQIIGSVSLSTDPLLLGVWPDYRWVPNQLCMFDFFLVIVKILEHICFWKCSDL